MVKFLAQLSPSLAGAVLVPCLTREGKVAFTSAGWHSLVPGGIVGNWRSIVGVIEDRRTTKPEKLIAFFIKT